MWENWIVGHVEEWYLTRGDRSVSFFLKNKTIWKKD
jgi:hypothetical protein